jgi:hypothetical protein
MRPTKLWVGLFGLAALLAPRTVLRLHAKVNLLGFRNTKEVEPSGWLVGLTRLGGLLSIAIAVFAPAEAFRGAADENESIDFV